MSQSYLAGVICKRMCREKKIVIARDGVAVFFLSTLPIGILECRYLSFFDPFQKVKRVVR